MLTRGCSLFVDKFIHDLEAQNFKYGDDWVQLVARPVQLWEVIFPNDALPTVLNTVGYGEDTRFKTPLAFLRKALGAKKIPKIDIPKEDQRMRLVTRQNVATYPFGIREDNTWDFGELKGRETL